jgi:hypothetical protein
MSANANPCKDPFKFVKPGGILNGAGGVSVTAGKDGLCCEKDSSIPGCSTSTGPCKGFCCYDPGKGGPAR